MGGIITNSTVWKPWGYIIYVSMQRCGCVEHGIECFSLYVQKHKAHLMACSAIPLHLTIIPPPPLLRDEPLELPAFLKVTYLVLWRFICIRWTYATSDILQGLYLLSGLTSYCRISESLARFEFRFFKSLWNLTGWANTPIKYQSYTIIIISNLAASKVREILRYDIYPLCEQRPKLV